MPWYFDPQSGGNKIPVKQFDALRKQVQAFAQTRKWFPKSQLSLRFKGQFCYMDERKEGEARPWPLARLRYFRDNVWSMAFYTWSHERFEPSILCNGEWQGTMEQVIETCEPFLLGGF
jgi:hypothetical protein